MKMKKSIFFAFLLALAMVIFFSCAASSPKNANDKAPETAVIEVVKKTENPFLATWSGYKFIRYTLSRDQVNSERDISLRVFKDELVFINHTTGFMIKGPYRIEEGRLIWELPPMEGSKREIITFYLVEEGKKLEGRSNLVIKGYYILRKE